MNDGLQGAGRAMRQVVMVDTGYEDYSVEQRILDQVQANIIEVPCQGDAQRVIEAVREADGVLVRETVISRQVIEQMPRCRAIVRYGAGIDNIDLKAAADHGIYVANVPDYGFEEVSDQAMALLMSVARRTVTRDAAVRGGQWNVSRKEPMHRIAGGVLGLVGYGRIARAFHRKALALGFSRTLIADPGLTQAPDSAEPADLETLCREADVISLHLPLTPATHHLIDAARLALMKPTAILLNTARGGLVDEHALAVALTERRLFGAGIDVFEVEPIAPANPLLALPNVVLSDHTGWYSEESIVDLQQKAAQELVRVFRGEQPVNWVNRW